MTEPKITVLMSVYNGEKYLRESIESILNQTFKDFEFIIIDDGSRDNSLEIISGYEDSRINLIVNPRNIGLAKSLNLGIRRAKGKYIARMDADDISLPERFQKQFDFMEKNPEVGVCGTHIKLFGAKSEVWSPPITHNEVFTAMLFESMTYHPTVFIRKSTFLDLEEFYDESFDSAQDYELWVRLALRGVKFANLEEILLLYRIHPNKVGKVHNKKQRTNSQKVRLNLLKKLNIKEPENKIVIHDLFKDGKNLSKKDFEKISKWVVELLEANKKEKVFEQSFLKKELSKRWFIACYNSCNNGFWVWKTYKKFFLAEYYKLSIVKKVKFFVRCLIKF